MARGTWHVARGLAGGGVASGGRSGGVAGRAGPHAGRKGPPPKPPPTFWTFRIHHVWTFRIHHVLTSREMRLCAPSIAGTPGRRFLRGQWPAVRGGGRVARRAGNLSWVLIALPCNASGRGPSIASGWLGRRGVARPRALPRRPGAGPARSSRDSMRGPGPCREMSSSAGQCSMSFASQRSSSSRSWNGKPGVKAKRPWSSHGPLKVSTKRTCVRPTPALSLVLPHPASPSTQ